jgi:hypothetical protein
VKSLLALLVLNPLFFGCAVGLALSMWLCRRWRLKTYPAFNVAIAVAVFVCLFALGFHGAIAVADYHAVSGGVEPTFLAYWLPIAAIAILAQLALAALRAGLAR